MEKRERDIESGLRRQVEKMGGKFMKFTSPGNDGVPDRIAVLPGGRIWFVELKREGEKPTAIQKWQMEQLRKMGCNVALITGKQEAIDWCIARGLDREQLEHDMRTAWSPTSTPQTIAEEVRDEILREYEAGGGS